MNDDFLRDFSALCSRHRLHVTRVTLEGVSGEPGPRPLMRFAASYSILEDGRTLSARIAPPISTNDSP